MKHLSEEEFVEMYYARGGAAGTQEGAKADPHLEECEECAAAFAALENDLILMREPVVPVPDENYEERVWARVEASLPPRARKPAPVRRIALWRRLAYVAAAAVLVAGAFYGGTVYEHWQHHKRMQARTNLPAPVQQPKVVIVVLGDHLDRSERLLVELKHADADSPELVNPLREEARSLMAANHVFREDAEKDGDAALTKALSHLDKLLTEVANQPGGLDEAALSRIREEMNADGLLFEVRVLRSKNPHRTTAVRLPAKGGAA